MKSYAYKNDKPSLIGSNTPTIASSITYINFLTKDEEEISIELLGY